MLTTRTAAIVVALAALAASGCQSSRLSSINAQPEPLPPAPSGKVTNQSLPPPSATLETPPAQTEPQTQVAAATPPADAADLTVNSVAGVWNASVSGQSCKIATPQTKYGQGFRAGPLRCPAPLDGVKSWSVSGKQLTLYDDGGGALARLYSTGSERFDGQTTSGLPVSLSR